MKKANRNLRQQWPQWDERDEWEERWLTLLGEPGYPLEEYRRAGLKGAEKVAETICEAPGDDFEVESWRLAVGPRERQKIILLRPRSEARKRLAINGKLPCAIVPFYEPETSAGLELDSDRHGLSRVRVETTKLKLRQYGLDLVRRGYLVVCAEAYPFNMVPPPAENAASVDGTGSGDGFARWRAAAAVLREHYPSWTGLGKLVHDTRCAITFLLQQPDADASRLAAMGHSLGGKMAFYTGCLDERVKAIVASDFGLPWASTNWDDAWYLGAKRPAPGSDLTHDKLLALLAPGAFFLIAGETDDEESWEIVERARPLFPPTPGDRLAWFNHASGHSPTPESLAAAYEWLERRWQEGC